MTASEFKPGIEGVFYGLPEEVYRPSLGVSQSTLKEFDEAGSPKHWKCRVVKSPTEDMQFGTLVHTAVLEPDKLEASYYFRPETYPAEEKGVVKQKPWSSNATWCREWVKAHGDRIIIKDAEVLQRVRKCAEALRHQPSIGVAIEFGKKEVAHYKKDAETGLLLRCKADLMAVDNNGVRYCIDFKKVQAGCANHDDFNDSIIARGYHIQAAYYLDITGADRFAFAAFDDDTPHDVALWTLPPEFLHIGRLEYRRILKAFAECLKADLWPGYGEDVKQLTMPPWLRKREMEINQKEHDAWLHRIASQAAA